MPDKNVVTEFWKKNRYFIPESCIQKYASPNKAAKFTEILSEIFCAGPSYYYIVDFATREILYMSPSVQQVLGLDPANTCFDDIVDTVHIDDLSFIQVAEEFNIRKTLELGMDLVFQTKMSYCFREKTANGTYELFQLQALCFDADPERNAWKLLNIHTNINHLTTVNNYKLTLTGINGHDLFLQFDLKKKLEINSNKPTYTPRELEIIKLIAQGLETPEIASELFISPHTAKTHRKNIMQKAGAKNTAQLISFCLGKGLL
ncbi:helix-turn-helix transcriptional regulator [Niabella yanshanensis]|uniref:Helix-turn-helix transcriptional regulator n=1 Tax=Niabella yanshanensis TaxID=577386 RepID=A0ABZ0W3R2_9BACT|nr:helix-turn-helix transcriptional regulator [Niabella yanshanensis]WQD37910.1 helix-turn-helix transcriptional regulator [Niabella yanshanensis]